MVAKRFLDDITGEKKPIDLNELLDDVGAKNLLPSSIADYADKVNAASASGVEEFLCHLDQAEKAGQSNQCVHGANEMSNAARIAKANQKGGWGYYENLVTHQIKLFGNPPDDLATMLARGDLAKLRKRLSLEVAIPNSRHRVGDGIDNQNMQNTVLNQMRLKRNKKTFYKQKVSVDRNAEAKANRKNHLDAVNGEDGKSIGQRALLFDHTGKVYRGADSIRDNDVALEMSSKIPSENVNDGDEDDDEEEVKPKSTKKNHANKKPIGSTNDLLGGVAALGGVTAVVAIVAALLPLHFVTSAITFLTSITTFLTNVNNVASTYLIVVDGVLAMFGQKNSTKKLKVFVDSMLDNVFGKKHVQEAKALFAQAINSIAVTTKLLEKVQAGRSGTDNKIDELAFSLGTVNNSMKDAGLIPPDSPYMAQSSAIDEFVNARAKVAGNEDLKENIDSLTEEIKTHEEVNKDLATEKKAIEEEVKKRNEATTDLLKLVDKTKTNVDHVKEKDL